jgi:hypothetical protein
MALFTDGQINGLAELQNQESGILDVASVENIDLTAKMALAADEIATTVLVFLLRRATRDPKAATRRTVGSQDVAVTTPLKRWHALKTLSLTYRDAYNNQLNDRYQGKWKQYDDLAQAAGDSFLQVGVGLVSDPLPKASAPALGLIAGGAPAGTYYARAAWVNRAGEEGSVSEPASLDITSGLGIVAAVQSAPPNAVGWNVYVGGAPGQTTLQNDLPINVRQVWELPTGGLRAGRAPGAGQAPSFFVTNDKRSLRG